MYKILTLTIFLFQLNILIAQNSLAKIEYSYAEEAYSKKDYKKALEHLEEVKSILGSTNDRVMYLGIKSLSKTFSSAKNTLEDYIIYKKISDLASSYLTNFENDAPSEKLKTAYEIQKEFKNYAIEVKKLIKGKGYLIDKKYDGALLHFSIACEAGNPEACKNMADIYSTKQDYENTKKFIEKAIDLGSVGAKSNKGYFLYYGINGYVKDEAKGVQLIEDAFNSGLFTHSLTLGIHYISSNKEKSKKLLLISYNQLKQKKAAFYLYYNHDIKNKKTLSDALATVNDWLKKSPKNGRFNHYKGFLLLQNKENQYSGIKYYKLACDNGHAFSCSFLGNLYFKKRVYPYIGVNATFGVYRDKKKGKEYFQKACSLDPKYCN